MPVRPAFRLRPPRPWSAYTGLTSFTVGGRRPYSAPSDRARNGNPEPSTDSSDPTRRRESVLRRKIGVIVYRPLQGREERQSTVIKGELEATGKQDKLLRQDGASSVQHERSKSQGTLSPYPAYKHWKPEQPSISRSTESATATKDHIPQGQPSKTGFAPLRPKKQHEDHPPADDLSLWEELFPDVSPTTSARTRTQDRDMPRLELPSFEPAFESLTALNEDQHQLKAQEAAPKGFYHRYGRFEGYGPGVLVLHNASATLTEMDFRSLVPKGRHIREWTVASTDLLKVIPGRDPISLERQGFYYLIFKTIAAAKLYLTRAHEIHNACKLHMPTSLTSPILPPPGVWEQGEDLTVLIKTFTLAGPSQTLDLESKRFYPKSYGRDIINRGGYGLIVNNNGHFKVLLKLQGMSDLTSSELYKLIHADSKDRGEPWGMLKGSDAVQNLVAIHQHLQRVDPKYQTRLHREWSRKENPGEKDQEIYNAATGRADKAIWEKAQMRWLITFTNEVNAKRFAAAWNGRRIVRGSYDGIEQNEMPSIARCEFLW